MTTLNRHGSPFPIRPGVKGQGRTGVLGVGTDERQAGVKGEGPTGVWGVTSKTSYAGVYGEHTGTAGHGTVGIGKGGDAAVLGRNPSGEGVRGEGATGVRGEGATGVHGKSTGGIGVYGLTSGDAKPGVAGVNPSGYGGQFYGGKAQLKLDPTGSDGHPTIGSHSKGEIHLDKNAKLFVCVKDGTPGMWRMVRTVAT